MNIIFAVIQRFYGWPCLIKVQDNCEPYAKHMQTVCEPHANRMRTVCQPYTNRIKIVHKPYTNRMQCYADRIKKTVYGPYGNRTRAVCEPYGSDENYCKQRGKKNERKKTNSENGYSWRAVFSIRILNTEYKNDHIFFARGEKNLNATIFRSDKFSSWRWDGSNFQYV